MSAQQVKFRLSAEEVAVVLAALSEGESLAAFAKRATLVLASGQSVSADAQSRSVEAWTVEPVVDPTDRIVEERSELEARLEVLRGRARPGVRIAMICDHKECIPPYRRFFETEEQAARWKCPDHGRAVRQENRPYLGVSTV